MVEEFGQGIFRSLITHLHVQGSSLPEHERTVSGVEIDCSEQVAKGAFPVGSCCNLIDRVGCGGGEAANERQLYWYGVHSGCEKGSFL